MMKILSLELKNYQNASKVSLHPSIDRCLFKKMKIKLFDRLKKKQNLEWGSYLENEPFFTKSIESLREN